jgi:hypothetical protein
MKTNNEHIIRGKKWIEAATKAFNLQQQRRRLEDQEEKAIEVLRELSLGVSSKDGDFEYTCSERKGAVDYSRKEIQEALKNINLERYRKDTKEAWALKYTAMIIVDNFKE